MAIMLNGGPGTVYGPRAFDAFCEFADQRDAKAPCGLRPTADQSVGRSASVRATNRFLRSVASATSMP